MITTIFVPGAALEAEIVGDGPDLLLLHGFPHTRRVWDAVTDELAASRRVIALDLPGIGGSSRAAYGYDAAGISRDLLAALDALGSSTADVMALDVSVPAAFLVALTHPSRVRSLVLLESTLGTLPGAEEFLRNGAPWWFGFHQIPGLAEHAIVGNEGVYLDFFLRAGTYEGRGIDPAVRDAFVAAYSGVDSLRCGFEYYRAMSESDRQLHAAVDGATLEVPTMAIGAQPVGATLARQLAFVTTDLRSELLTECGHIIPLDRPAELVRLLHDFL